MPSLNAMSYLSEREGGLDPRRGGYVFREDGKFYRHYPAGQGYMACSQTCWTQNATLGVPFPDVPKAIALEMSNRTSYIAVGAFTPDAKANGSSQVWITNDGKTKFVS